MEVSRELINPANVMFLVESTTNMRIFYRSEDTNEDAIMIARCLDTDPQNVRLVDWECDFLSSDFGFHRCFEIHTQVLQASNFLQDLYFNQMLGNVNYLSVEETQKAFSGKSNVLEDAREHRDEIISIAIKLSGDDFFFRTYAIVKYVATESEPETNMVLTFSGVEDRALAELKKFGKMLTMERMLKLQENNLAINDVNKSFAIY